MKSSRSICAMIAIVTLFLYWRAASICNVALTHDARISEQEHPHLPTTLKHSLLPERQAAQVKTRRHSYDQSMFDIDVSNYTGPARAFPKWQHRFPCFPVPRQLMTSKPAKKGLLFLRPHKAGSTTLSGIVMRIAQRRAQNMTKHMKLAVPRPDPKTPLGRKMLTMTKQQREVEFRKNIFCEHRANHGNALHYQYSFRDKRQSFLFSIVRNPTRRGISHFFHFGVAAYRKVPSDRNFQDHLLKMQPNRFLSDLSVVPIDKTETGIDYEEVIRNVLEEYDFIFLLERFDESLVAMKMILGLDYEDILYVKDRTEGTFSNGDKNRPCVYILPSFVTPGMYEFLKSDPWNERIEGDVLLYQAVHKSLDLTIDSLGRDEFESQLTLFRQVNQRAHELCASRAVGMCTGGGDPVPVADRTCFIWSEGCSHACLDEIQVQDYIVK